MLPQSREMALLMRPKTAHRLIYRLACMDLGEYPLREDELESEIAHAYGEEISNEGPVDRVLGLVQTAFGRDIPTWGDPNYELTEEWVRDQEMHQALSTETP